LKICTQRQTRPKLTPPKKKKIHRQLFGQSTEPTHQANTSFMAQRRNIYGVLHNSDAPSAVQCPLFHTDVCFAVTLPSFATVH